MFRTTNISMRWLAVCVGLNVFYLIQLLLLPSYRNVTTLPVVYLLRMSNNGHNLHVYHQSENWTTHLGLHFIKWKSFLIQIPKITIKVYVVHILLRRYRRQKDFMSRFFLQFFLIFFLASCDLFIIILNCELQFKISPDSNRNDTILNLFIAEIKFASEEICSQTYFLADNQFLCSTFS